MRTYALLYRPASQWTTATGFLCALLILAAAICFGQTKVYLASLGGVPDDPGVDVELFDTEPQSTEVPEDQTTEVPPSTPPADAFVEEKVERHNTPVAKRPRPLTRPVLATANRSHGSGSEGESAALFAPRPDYPYEARRQNATGSGLASLTINPASGVVTSARMKRTTGRAILDASALKAFAQWRFRPGAGPIIDIPITFTLTGASY